MPVRDKVYEKMKSFGLTDSKEDFYKYYDSDENVRKDVFRRLQEDGLTDTEEEFYSYMQPSVVNNEEPDTFDANVERAKNGEPIQRVSTQSMIDAHPELGLKNIPNLPTLKDQVEKSNVRDGKPVFGKPGFNGNEVSALYPMSSETLSNRLSDPRILDKDMSIRSVNEADEEKKIDAFFHSKPMKTAKDVYDNYSARFSNTERGIELGEELSDISRTITDKYANEYFNSDSYKKLAKLYQGEELANKANEEFQKTYGETINKELKPYQDAYNNELSIRYGSNMDEALRSIAKESVSGKLSSLTIEVESMLKDSEEKLKQHRPIGGKGLNAIMGNQQYLDNTRSQRKERNMLESAQELLDDSQNIVNEASKKGNTTFIEGLARGFWDNLNAEDFTFGLAELADMKYLNEALKKAEQGEQLTPAEEKLLEASTINMATQAYFSSDLGRGYKAGSVTAESIPFMLEFIANPISGSGNAIAKGLLKFGLKRFGKSMTSKTAKAVGRLIGDATSAVGMTSTTGMPSVLAETYNRLNRNYNYGVGEDGELYVNKEGDTSFGEAFGKSFTTRAIENQSEMIFHAFKGAGNLLKGVDATLPGGVNTFFDYIKNSKVGELWRGIKNSPLRKELAEATKVGGIGEEYLEEVYNNFANVALGEMSMEEALNLDNNIDTFLGLAPTQVMFSMLGLGNMAALRYKTRRDIEDLRATMNESQRQALDGLLAMGTTATNQDVHEFIRNTMANQSLSIDEKRNAVKAAYDVARQKAMADVQEAEVEDKIAEENADIDAKTDPQTGNYGEVTLLGMDESGEPTANTANVFGAKIVDGELYLLVLPEGETEKKWVRPHEYDAESHQIMPGAEVKAYNEQMIRDNAAKQVEEEAKYAPDVLNAQMQQGVPFEDETAVYVPFQVTPEGNAWQVEVYNKDENGKPSKDATGVNVITNDQFRDILQTEYDRKEMQKPETEEPKQRGTVSTPVALAYLLEGGQNSIENLGYFLHGVAAAFPELENEIETIRGNIGEGLGVSPDRFAEVAPREMAEMRQVIESKYGKEGSTIFDELVANSTGYVPKVGAEMALRLENLKPIQNEGQQPAQEAAVPVNVPSGENVGEEVNAEVNAPVNNENVQPVAEGVATEPQAEEAQPEVVEEVQQPQQQAPIIPTKEDGSIDFVSYGKDNTFKTLGEKYGEKMPNKVAVTAKALAEDLVKAQEKLAKAEEAYDNAPIGREQKAEQARDKAKAELESIQREADFWSSLDNEIKEAQAKRDVLLNPKADVDMSEEPMTADEFIAQQLANGNIALESASYKKETGYGEKERQKFIKMFRKAENGGMSIESAGDLLMQMDRENGTNFFNQDDANAGRDALINFLGSVSSWGDVTGYIRNNREAQAAKETEGLRNEIEDAIEANYHMTPEEYATLQEMESTENPFEGVDIEAKDAIFAEAALEYEEYLKSLENGQGTTEEVIEGNSDVLSEEQSDNTGGTEQRQGEGLDVSEGTVQSDDAAQEESAEVEEGNTPFRQTESILEKAERIANEEARRKPLRQRAKEWEQKLGVKVNIIENFDDVTNKDAKRAIRNGQRVTGWYEESTGEVCLYMPYLESAQEIDATYIHEVVAHKGLRGLLGDKFDEFLDDVWNAMSEADKLIYLTYPGVNGNKRAAADEYIAHLAENIDVTESAWGKLAELIKKFLKAIGLEPKMTHADIANTIKLSYQRLLSGEGGVDVVGDGTRFRTLEEINQTFNEELQQQIDGTLPNGHIYQLGSPSAVLLSTGIADVPIELNSTRLEDKSKNFGHDYDLSELKDLVKAIHNPMAIFAYGDKSKAQNIIVEIQHEGKNFIVGLSIKPKVGGQILDINSIRNVFPKDNAEWLNWVSQGKLLYADKERIQDLINQQQTNLADVDFLDLDSIANIVKDFPNPTLPEEKTLFRTVYHGSAASFDKFDHSFMGTGEGNQSFGWGTYVTDVEGIAKQYASIYAKNSPLAANALRWIEENGTYEDFLAQGEGKRRNWAIRHAKDYLKELKKDGASEDVIKAYEQDLVDAENALSEEAYNRTKENMVASLNRNLYEVEIPDNDGTNYIAWDKMLPKEQAERIKEAVRNSDFFKAYEKEYGRLAEERLDSWTKTNGGRAYKLLGNFTHMDQGADKAISQLLSKAGFVGFEYPANYMSGGNDFGQKNYVIFDEKDLQIKEHTRFRVLNDKNGRKSLVGLHNISENKLRKAIKQGGLANPSVAVIDMDKQSHTDYGDITFVIPSSMIDKKTGKNVGTYLADAYTPVYPTVVKKMSDKGAKALTKALESVDEIFRSKVRTYFNSYLDSGTIYDALAYWYLSDTEKNPPILEAALPEGFTKEEVEKVKSINSEADSFFQLSEDEKQKALNLYADKFFGGMKEYENHLSDYTKRMQEVVKDESKPQMVRKNIQQNLNAIERYGYEYDRVAGYYNRAVFLADRQSKPSEIETFRNAFDEVSKNGLEEDFGNWLMAKEEEFGVEEKLFAGYDNQGRAKYLPNTLENASKLMKKEGRAGATGLGGFNYFVAILAPVAKNAKQINAKKQNLSTQEEYDKFAKQWSEYYHNLALQLQPGADKWADYGYHRLHEIAPMADPRGYVKREYGIELSDEFMKDLNEVKNAIKNDFPARYFETKFERPVYLNEVAAAVVPDNMSLDLYGQLQRMGIPMYEYENGNNEARMEAIDKVTIDNEGIRFRIAPQEEVQAEVDKFTSKYNGKEVVVFNSTVSDEELESLGLDVEDVREAIEKETEGFYDPITDKIYIFADIADADELEKTLFHENGHGIFRKNKKFVNEFNENSKDKFKKGREDIAKYYKEHERAEELFVRIFDQELTSGNFEYLPKYLSEELWNEFNDILKDFGYDRQEESDRRRKGSVVRTETDRGSEKEADVRNSNIEPNQREERKEKGRSKEQAERLKKLFDDVADMGLRGVLGNTNYDLAMLDIFYALPEKERTDVAVRAVKIGGDVAVAVDEYLNSLEEPTFWEKVVASITNALRKVGIDVQLTENDVKYLLWRSRKPLDRNSIFDMAEDIDMRRKLKVGKFDNDPTDGGDTPGGGTRFRVANKLQIRDEYESTIKKGGYQAREAVQDAMLSLRRTQELIEKASGKKLRGFENAWEHENRLSSVVQAEIHEMERKFYKPMMDAVKKLAEAMGDKNDYAVADYLMLKHGIERNREMAVRKALTDTEGKIDRTQLEQWYKDKDAIRNDANLPTWREKQEAMDNAALNYGADMSVDYSGLTSMFGSDDLADCTDKAYKEVESLEKKYPSETKALGKAVKALNQSTIDKSFESGLMDRKVRDELKNDMYDYYVPLRGFDEVTSDEVYSYLDNDRNAFNAPLRRAKGRTSKADNPIAYMKSIAESGIMQGERNKMKQSFLNMVTNHPSDLVSVREGVWVVLNPATGEWEAASMPTIPNNATPADVESILEAWEASMEQQAATNPNIKKISEGADIPYRVIGNRMEQHQVIIKRNGKSYTLTVNGNPRLAMALNGLTNPNNTSKDGRVAADIQKAVDKMNRTLAAWYTTRNPDFVASNFMRDTFYTNTIVRAKEGNKYANKFHKHYAELLMPGKMLSLFNKYENGKLDMNNKTEKAFYDFIMNGGETGYSNLKDIEHIKNEIANQLKGDRLKWFRQVSDKLDLVNRAVENTSRFAAFLTSREMGRDMSKSIFDAKEISVNFNKKGAGGTFYKGTGQTKFGNLAAMVGAGGRGLYVFFNAAIQGSTNLLHVMKVNPKGTSAGLAAMFLMGAVLPYLLSGDDDKDYYDLPEHVRRNHLVLPGAGDTWVSIPLPIEYRIMYGMGELFTSWRTGHERGSNVALKALSLTGQALPLNFLEEGLDAFVPSALSPLWQAYNNRSWTGLPIYKDNEFNKDDPEYTKAYKNVDRLIYNFTKSLYDWTFDEENQEAGIDLNPAVIESLARGYFGGLFTQMSNIVKTAETIGGEREFDWRNIPIGNRIFKSGDEQTKEKRITNEYFNNMEKLDFLESRRRMLNRTIDGKAVPEEDVEKAKADLEQMIQTGVYQKYMKFKEYKKVADKIRKAMKDNGLTEELQRKLSEAQEKANEVLR